MHKAIDTRLSLPPRMRAWVQG